MRLPSSVSLPSGIDSLPDLPCVVASPMSENSCLDFSSNFIVKVRRLVPDPPSQTKAEMLKYMVFDDSIVFM